MEESKEKTAQPSAEGGHSRDEDATSSETLSEIEEGENVKSQRETGSPTETSSPNPTPANSSEGGRADGSDTGGPM